MEEVRMVLRQHFQFIVYRAVVTERTNILINEFNQLRLYTLLACRRI